jgi:hypothetical protein
MLTYADVCRALVWLLGGISLLPWLLLVLLPASAFIPLDW